ncbi:hypothetical protein KOM00_14765 [Geomonas sp. Red69]|uniref:hypothetical protein n=1 Tax=Geomonas diazotrophica TaxID=2843197 RepID=UPI001C0FBD64|nr:hypothetical protein [Geomonas diazotrophica]MBU5637989.1 hypothetical protein [Geomonas diazotrophica]
MADQIVTLDIKIAKLSKKRASLAAGVNKKAGEVVMDNLDMLPTDLRMKVEVLAGIEGEPEFVEEQFKLGEVVPGRVQDGGAQEDLKGESEAVKEVA